MHRFTRHSSHKANDDLRHSSEALKLRYDLFISIRDKELDGGAVVDALLGYEKRLRKPGVRENSQNGTWQNEKIGRAHV